MIDSLHIPIVVVRPWESGMRCMVNSTFPRSYNYYVVCCEPTHSSYFVITYVLHQEIWAFKFWVAKQQTTYMYTNRTRS